MRRETEFSGQKGVETDRRGELRMRLETDVSGQTGAETDRRGEFRMRRRVILASASPRRRELLARIGVDFDVLVSESEERTEESQPSKVVVSLARGKARAVADMLESAGSLSGEIAGLTKPGAERPALKWAAERSEPKPDAERPALVLGADTIVVLDGKILGKPRDASAARQMLRSLSGRSHHVLTGVCGIYLPEGREKVFFEETEVMVDTLSDAEIEAYLASGEPFDKAGSYGIQGIFSRHVRGIIGDYFNVVGLPLHRVYKTFFADVRDACGC